MAKEKGHDKEQRYELPRPWASGRGAEGWPALDFENCSVAASGPTIWTSTYGLESVLCIGLLVEPSGWAQTVHMFTQPLVGPLAATVANKGCFLTFEWEKTNFTTFGPPRKFLEKSSRGTLWQKSFRRP